MQTNDWSLVYDLASDTERIATMQRASLGATDRGLNPATLVGSPDWWHEIETGTRPPRQLEGTIVDVFWGSMRDWPEFQLSVAGHKSSWTREGDVRLYVRGLAARLTYVEHDLEPKAIYRPIAGPSQVVVRVEVAMSAARSSGIAPGPNGMIYDMMRRQYGDVVHYFKFGESASAKTFAEALSAEELITRIWGAASCEGTMVSAWHRDTTAAWNWRQRLTERCQEQSGVYDGGEVVGGEVWGPGSNWNF